MREILFRGKTNNNNWVEGAYYKQEEFYGDKEEAHVIITSKDTLDNDLGLWYSIVIPETVGQYTGLTDKNGTKIFEGDIVKHDFGADQIGVQYAVVEYDLKYASFMIKPIYDWMFCDKDDCEVISNIHDNPELVKEQQND